MEAGFILLKRGAESLSAKLETVREEEKIQIVKKKKKKKYQQQIFPPPFWAF